MNLEQLKTAVLSNIEVTLDDIIGDPDNYFLPTTLDDGTNISSIDIKVFVDHIASEWTKMK